MSFVQLTPETVVERIRVKLAGRPFLENFSVGLRSKQGQAIHLENGELQINSLKNPSMLFLRLQKKEGIAEYFFNSFEESEVHRFIEESCNDFKRRNDNLTDEIILPSEFTPVDSKQNEDSQSDLHFLNVNAEEKSNRLMNLEESLKSQVPDHSLSFDSRYQDQKDSYLFWSSASPKMLSFEKVFGVLDLQVALKSGDRVSTFQRAFSESYYFDIDWSGLGRDVLQNALRMLNPSLILPSIPHQNLFHAQTVCEILEKFQSFFCYDVHGVGEANPMLKYFRKPLFPPIFQVIDDPTQKKTPTFVPWSFEGQQTANLPLIVEGRPVNFCSTLKGSKLREGASSFHRRWLPDSSKFEVAPYGLLVEAGRLDFVDLLREMKRGYLILRLDEWLDVDLKNGDFRVLTSGMWVEDGEIRDSLTQITLSSNFFDMFQSLDSIGRDLQSRGNMRSPCILFGKLPLSGA